VALPAALILGTIGLAKDANKLPAGLAIAISAAAILGLLVLGSLSACL